MALVLPDGLTKVVVGKCEGKITHEIHGEGGFGYKLYDIVVPEGGFAITSHGETNNLLIDMLSQGMVTNYDISNINNRTIYDSNIRLSYDASEKTVNISFVS